MNQQAEPYYVEQRLKVEIPAALWDLLFYAKAEIISSEGFRGGAAEVRFPSGKPAGVLVYYPGVSLPLGA